MIWTYVINAAFLVIAELVYFKIADKCNIIDKPNERSGHTKGVLLGGGIIFAISMIVLDPSSWGIRGVRCETKEV